MSRLPVGYVLYETLPPEAPLAEHRAQFVELPAHPMQENEGIIRAIDHTRWCIEVYHEAPLTAAA